MTGHPTVPEIAEAAERLLGADHDAEITQHLAGCPDCQQTAAALREVSSVLAAEPRPTMPPSVAARLSAALGEHASRPRRIHATAPVPRTSLGAFGADRHRHPVSRWIGPVLVAAVFAALVGFGGYVLSARAGMNEPPVVAAVNSAELGADAKALQKVTDLDPHRFSQAWQCARQVTSGRIVGLATTVVDGSPALLVYTRSGGRTLVTVVSGCHRSDPSAGPSAVLNR